MNANPLSGPDQVTLAWTAFRLCTGRLRPGSYC